MLYSIARVFVLRSYVVYLYKGFLIFMAYSSYTICRDGPEKMGATLKKKARNNMLEMSALD